MKWWQRDRSSKGIFSRNKLIINTNSLNLPFHSIKQILEFFVKHDNLISVQSYAVPILQCHPPHVCYTWHGKLLVAKGVPNYKKKIKNTCSLQYIRWVSWARIEDHTAYCCSLPHLPKCKATKDHVLNYSIFPYQNRLVCLFHFFPKRGRQRRK